ncbi:MAG: hypothetical protein U5J82_15020 [Desulfobacterales bacterium]|nr:hypothetical protein [Desulfobacterales bacterium]
MTPVGKRLLRNFLKSDGQPHKAQRISQRQEMTMFRETLSD